jgi:protein O-mannosyl-transferase
VNFKSLKPAHCGGFSLSVLVPLFAPILLAVAVWLLFAPALPGIIQFDDLGNLSDLSTITGIDSAWSWVNQGRAGPLGRPIALMTFALQYSQWPEPYELLLWNIVLHVINALLVFWLSMLVARSLGAVDNKPVIIGFLTALTWSILPMLNTSTLFIIQRMTVLSSTFMLMGLISYIKLRGKFDATWIRQIAALISMAVFGMLAVLTKENGALIVVYGLIIEWSISAQQNEQKKYISAASVLLALACALLVAKLLPILIWSQSIELQRGFTMPERLASQAMIMIGYLKALFIPSSFELNPYRGFVVSKGQWNTIWGISLWIALMLSPVIIWLRQWRLVALAVAWFFYGHILESGWVPLELYFAHRNYFPAMGLVFCLIFFVINIKTNKIFWRSVFGIYLAVLATMTFMNTSLWGNSGLASEIWAKEQPQSIRAAMNLAYELERTQGLAAAQSYLENFVDGSRDSAGLRLVSISNTCQLNPTYNLSDRVQLAKNAILDQPYEGWGTDVLEKLIDPVRKGLCPGLTERQVGEIAATYLSKPVYQQQPAIASNMLSILGLVAMDEDDIATAMNFYLQAIEHSPTYSMSKLYLYLSEKYPHYSDLERLNDKVASAPVPRKTSKEEWVELQNEINSALIASER